MDVVPLVGYMDQAYAKWFLTNRCLLPEAAGDVNILINRCRAGAIARDVPTLKPEIIALPENALTSQIKNDKRIHDMARGMPWSLAQVEIDPLVSLQKDVNVTYADGILREFSLEDLDERIRLCLTDVKTARTAQFFEARGSHLFAIKSAGTDLRVVDSEMTQVPERGEVKMSFTVGWGHPFVTVFRIGERYVLDNGYHRAYALRKSGVKHIPCLLIEANNYDDLQLAGEPSLFGPETILGPRPPTFSVFFDERISPRVKIRPFSTVVIIRPTITSLDSEKVESYFSSQTSATQDLSLPGLAYVDLTPRFEDWSAYLLEDGTMLKLRAVLTMGRRLPDGALGGAMISDHLWFTNPPRGRKGPKSPPVRSSEELNASIVRRNMKFTIVKEPVNEYVTEKGEMVLLTLRLLTVSKTSRYDANGDPIYIMSFTRDMTLA